MCTVHTNNCETARRPDGVPDAVYDGHVPGVPPPDHQLEGGEGDVGHLDLAVVVAQSAEELLAKNGRDEGQKVLVGLECALGIPVLVQHDKLNVEHVLLASALVNQVREVEALQRGHSLPALLALCRSPSLSLSLFSLLYINLQIDHFLSLDCIYLSIFS